VQPYTDQTNLLPFQLNKIVFYNTSLSFKSVKNVHIVYQKTTFLVQPLGNKNKNGFHGINHFEEIMLKLNIKFLYL
jgi:hypothetical protein